MHTVYYRYKELEKLGFLNKEKDNVISAKEIFEKLGINTPKNVNEFIEMSNIEIIKKIKEILKEDSFKKIPLEDVVLLSPIPYTKRNMFCVGKNYLDHINELDSAKELKGEIPKNPIYFSKVSYPTVGPNQDIIIDWSITDSIDYEVELAVIIGEKCKNVDKNDAERYIFGYTIANDISARDIQMSRIQWHKGKSLDNFSPLGPYILHKTDLPMPFNLKLESYVNGELRQSSSTSNLIFDIPYLISDLSKGMTLYPGDIILTGTPSGVGMGFKPPKLLKSKDIVECKIEKLGTLTNKIV